MRQPAREGQRQFGHRVWRGYYPGSGFAFAEKVDGWSYEIDGEVLFGRRLPDPLPRLTVTKLSPGELPGTLAMAGSGILVCTRLHAVLSQAVTSEIQSLPASIKRDPQARYALVNLLASVACLDRVRSECEAYEDPPHAIRTLRKMVLTPIAADAPAAFHMAEMPGVILIRDDLREAMQAVSVSAGEFVPVDEYRRGV
ncbi:MAG: hypothetical protein ACLPV8_27175 [Steroidobacteraceae bacterium]